MYNRFIELKKALPMVSDIALAILILAEVIKNQLEDTSDEATT